MKWKSLLPEKKLWEHAAVRIHRAKIDNDCINKVFEYKYLGYLISDQRMDMNMKLTSNNNINDIAKRNVSKNENVIINKNGNT